MMGRHDNPPSLWCCEPDSSLPIKKCVPRKEHLAQVMNLNAEEKRRKTKTTFQHAQIIHSNIKIVLMLLVQLFFYPPRNYFIDDP